MLKDRTYRWILFPLVFLNVFFLCALASARFFLRGETVVVPDIVGKTYAQAKAELGRFRVSLSLKSQQFDGRWEKGRIISQSPAAGARISTGRSVQVVVSRGSEQVVVPRLLNRSLEASLPVLKKTGLIKGQVAFIHTPAHAAGRIIAQDPAPESTTQRETPVDLLVSQGEIEDKYIMPDLLGLQAEAARRELSAQGFRLSYSGSSYYPGLEPGTIIRQSPPKGHAVMKRTLITVEVSR